jgi:hypothetical protein
LNLQVAKLFPLTDIFVNAQVFAGTFAALTVALKK